jgi:hypothetical protein
MRREVKGDFPDRKAAFFVGYWANYPSQSGKNQSFCGYTLRPNPTMID